MIIYYIAWGILCILAICEFYTADHPRLRSYARLGVNLLAFFLFFIIVGLKGNVGSDYLSYQDKYDALVETLSYDWRSSLEPGFWYWMKGCSILGIPFVIFWLLTSFCNLCVKAYTFSKISPYISISYAIYFVGLFFERDFDGIRQGISIGLSYLSIIYLLRNQTKRFYLLVVLACLFHYTSVIFLMVPYFQRHIKPAIIWGSIAIAFVLLWTGTYLFDLEFISNVGYGNIIAAKLSSYAMSSKYAAAVGLSIGMLFRMGILYLFITSRERLNISNALYNILKNGFAISIICSMLFGNIDIISHRLMFGFREFQIFIIPLIVSSIHNRNYRLLAIVLCLVYSLWLLYRLLNSNMQQFYYYQTFFS